MSYSPKTHLAYIPVMEMGSKLNDRGIDVKELISTADGTVNPGYNSEQLPGTGALVAWDPLTQKAAWKVPQPTIINGGGSQTGTLTRWGDYSALQVDPSDDCTFWFTTEYLKASGTFNWNTRIASFKFPNCGGTADYSLSASPASLTITQGGSGSSTITVTPSNGFNGSVSLSASGLPAGVTASFNPASTTSTSTLTLTAGSTATTGAATVTVTGASGSLSHTTSVNLTVNAASASPSISLSATSLTFGNTNVGSTSVAQSITLTNNGPGAVSISSIAASGDFAQTNTCGASVAQGGTCSISVTFKPTASGTRNGTLTVTSNASNSPTSASLSGTGVSTAQQLLGNPGFENGSANVAPWTLTAGVINNSASQPPHSGAWDAWLDGYGTTHTDSATQTVTIPSTAAISRR